MHLSKSESQIFKSSPSVLKAVLIATRPKTLAASIAPVCIGVCLIEKIDAKIFFLTALFSLFIQIGTNFCNDYFDYIKGADTQQRIGPARAVQKGWIKPKTMLNLAFLVFVFAFIFAIPLMLKAGAWSFFVALICIFCAIFYTAGPKPFGYLGLGEILAFVFYGPVATIGSFYLQKGFITVDSFIASIAPGCFSAAMVLANNIRDENTDKIANKNTLVVRFGSNFGKWTFASLMIIAPLSGMYFEPMLIFVLLANIPIIQKVFSFNDRKELIEVLTTTGLSLIVYSLIFCLQMLL